jgi:N-acetyl-alpha-D-glucosaminyl L-malate synthase BshA
MKIGITCLPTAGGSGILATDLGIALAERGHQIHFVTLEPLFRLRRWYSNVFVHTVAMTAYPQFKYPPYTLSLATKMLEVAEEHGIEIWHAHYAIPHATSAILARDMLPPEKRFKIVTTLHGTDITLVGLDPSFYRMTKYAMENSDAVTAVSRWLTEATEREFDLSVPIRTIYNFLDVENYPPETERRCSLAVQGEKIVMHISNFRPVKRVTDVVRAFKKIVDRVPETRLVMIGDGPDRMLAVGVARQLGIDKKITYLGTYENVASIIPCADLVFQPSEHESFGLVPLEAMACEVPVLGTASGGVMEVVEHGVTGFLAEVGNTDAMAEYAIQILTNPVMAKEMGKRGRERALRLFSKRQIVSEYEELYRSLLAEPVTAGAEGEATERIGD